MFSYLVQFLIPEMFLNKNKICKYNISSIKVNGSTFSDHKEIANEFNNCFTSIADILVIADKIHPTVSEATEEEEIEDDVQLFQCANSPVSVTELLDV